MYTVIALFLLLCVVIVPQPNTEADSWLPLKTIETSLYARGDHDVILCKMVAAAILEAL